ncbi:unnamed protein product [Zymoseptoria tritici ST99CH_1A5]|uniref:Uncharacterized protein n=3 Tax=Zymoseptoria tritici TaxID=1047171 RepID=A0A1X7S672_ZYMT9|nr:unnamed protein product [Zymoseptoria tritici ST99CH_3D7]SMR60223.1 unnamed protein product [Zymoseptoria tritici ST99CH_1E4]SMR63334.1 unnamed protein product [Zymoseptoria tritici ST99CH_3D1]SMY28675.1 unnamed protein product [Zymoseptoria tritici ST99CH_1A5]
MLFQTFAVAIAFAAHTLAALPGNGLQGRTCQNPQSNDDKSICKAASCYWTQLRSYATQKPYGCCCPPGHVLDFDTGCDHNHGRAGPHSGC